MVPRQGLAAQRAQSYRFRTAALLTALIGSTIVSITEVASMMDGRPDAWARFGAFVLIALTAAYQLARNRRTGPFLIITGASFGVLSLIEVANGTYVDTGITLAALILMLVIYVSTREQQKPTGLIVASSLTAVYALAAVIAQPRPISETVGVLLVGIPGQALVVWITWRLIDSLGRATRHEAGIARIQEALATCSQALLTGRDEEPLNAALAALLDATEADYAYVDVNRVDDEGRTSWEIVAEAMGSNVPPGPSAFDDGDYTQLSAIHDALSAGRPGRLRVTDLEIPIRGRYEAEGIKSELMAPIMIRGQWVGTLGYSDFWRDDAWTDFEVDGLMRAAEMVGAYWERESAREGLEELAKAKDRFIATVSHELRTPLAAVVGFAGELAQGLDEYTRDEIAEMVSLISSQSIEVAQLVDDLLTAERAASGNLTVKPARLDLLHESRSVLDLLRAGRDVDIEGESIPVWADALRTRQIVRNLLTNAVRYGGTSVRMEVGRRNGQAVLAVMDDGHGVTGIDAEHIFDPYYRSKTQSTKPDSVGLGLAVARQLARLMGGDVVYRRNAGWTRFELTLPLASEPVAAAVG